ncbi:MAG: sulfur carrier protein [Circular genetic element sp.]|nr:MAG: sulfur carrier protein [Circular genetic element sp.]
MGDRVLLKEPVVNSPLADIRQAIHRPAPESRGCARMHAPLRSSRCRFQRPEAVDYLDESLDVSGRRLNHQRLGPSLGRCP